MADEALRKRKVRALTKAGFVFRYGNWVLPRHEVPFSGMVLSAASDARKVLREDGWSESEIREALPDREEVSEEGASAWANRGSV